LLTGFYVHASRPAMRADQPNGPSVSRRLGVEPFLHNLRFSTREQPMAKTQKAAARRNIKKAAKAAQRKRTIAHLPKKTRTALGKEAAKAAKRAKR
jgi:hypothetical protein